MKARFKVTNGKIEICQNYPKCNCKGHYVFEPNKKKGEEE